MTPTEQFTEREELSHALGERIDREYRFGERDDSWLMELAVADAKLTRTLARKAAVRNIRLVRSRYE